MSETELKTKLSEIYKTSWLLNNLEYVIITRDLLWKFSVKITESEILLKLKRLGIPFEILSYPDPQCSIYNCIEQEMRLFPKKTKFIKLKHEDFKHFLFLISGTARTGDLHKYYISLETCVRNYINKKNRSEVSYVKFENILTEAMKKLQIVVDPKTIDKK